VEKPMTAVDLERFREFEWIERLSTEEPWKPHAAA
jgi:hypothetical protein